MGFQSPIFSDVSIVGEIRLASLFSTVAGASPHLFEVELSTAVFVAWECLPFSKRPAFRALVRCFWRDRVSVFCAAFAELAMFSNVSKHLLNIAYLWIAYEAKRMRAFWPAACPGCLGNCAKCRSRRRKKARKCPKIKSWWWHSLQGCPAPQPSRRAPRTPGTSFNAVQSCSST